MESLLTSTLQRTIASRLEQLMTTDVSSRGVIDVLYRAARRQCEGPIVERAADALLKAVGGSSTVLILTGYPTKAWFVPGLTECDGPIGSASLGRYLQLCCDTTPLFLTESSLARFMIVAARAAGFIIAPEEAVLARQPRPAPVRAASVLPFPVDPAAAAVEAKRLLDAAAPAAIVAIEMPGIGRRGHYHSSTGVGVAARYVPRFEILLEEAKARGIPSIGVADGGAEIGMGVIEDVVRREIPFGASCKCPCGDGMASHVATDVLVVATISNWGAHALGMMLAAMTGRSAMLHDGNLEVEMIQACVREGAVDGMAPGIGMSVDGLDAAGNAAMVDLMRSTVNCALARQHI